MIPEQVIEQIAAANDIVDVINGYFPLKRAGAVYKALCPFHREKSPSFTVNPARQTFKCFGCGAGGTVFKFVELYENVHFPEAAKRLAARRGIRFEDEPLSAEEDARHRMKSRLLALHAAAAEWFHRILLKSEAAQHARNYLKSRGITAEVAKSWKIGYAPESWDALSQWARSKGYYDAELIASGLVTSKESEEPNRPTRYYDRFRDRLMFPICNDIGEVIAFSGRVLSAEAFGGKYVNSPETPIFTKGKVLFGLHKAKRALIDSGTAIVCEGQVDLITAFEAGVRNVTASQGTAFTENQASILKRFVKEVVLCFDSDAAGLKAAEKTLEPLLDVGLSVRVATMPEGHDPDSFIRSEGGEVFAARIAGARDFFEFQVERFAASPEFTTPRGKADFARKMAEGVSLISDAVLREAVIQNVSARLEIPAAQFAALLKRSNRPAKQEWKHDAAQEGEPPSTPPLPPMSNTIRILCRLALVNEDTRQWLLARKWEALLAELTDGEILACILRGRFNPAEPASLSTFIATLPPAEQAAIADLLAESLPEVADPLPIVTDCWRDLERRALQNRRDIATARLRQPGLSLEEEMKLQKQVLDLTQRLTHITRPLSPPP